MTNKRKSEPTYTQQVNELSAHRKDPYFEKISLTPNPTPHFPLQMAEPPSGLDLRRHCFTADPAGYDCDSSDHIDFY